MFQVENQSAAGLAHQQPPPHPQSWYSDPVPTPACVPCEDGGGSRVLMTCPADWNHLTVRSYIEKSFRHLQVRVYHVIVRSLAAGGGDCAGWTIADVWLHRKMGGVRAAEAINAMLCAPPHPAPGGGLPIRFLAVDTQVDYGCPAADSLSATTVAVNCWSSATGSTQAAGTGGGSRSAKKKRSAGAHALPLAQVEAAAAKVAAAAGAEIAEEAARAATAAGEDLEVLRLLPYGFALSD
jgi:hypothetical protein